MLSDSLRSVVDAIDVDFGLPAFHEPADEGEAQIRPVRADDAGAVGEFIRQLSPLSRQRRFHAGVRELSPELLRRFTQPDPWREHALIALAIEDGRAVVVGEARYAVADDHPASREFGLAVADHWQGQGLGRRMLCALTRHARRRSVHSLFGDVLPDNLPMLALARDLGYRVRRHPSDARLLRVVRGIDGVAAPAGQSPDFLT